MIAKDDFYTYKSGVYRSSIVDHDPDDDNKRIHSVKIIGYDLGLKYIYTIHVLAASPI